MQIFQNTLIKLIFRQGSNSDRLVKTFQTGEPIFTTDTQRMFVGNGQVGGIVVGNVYQGSSTDITTYTSSLVGDLAFDTDKSKLYRLKYPTANTLSAWENVGGLYGTLDNKISISNTGLIGLNPLSAGIYDASSLAVPIVLNSNSQISLSSKVPLLEVVPLTGSSIRLPVQLQIGVNTFTFPVSAIQAGQFIQAIDNSGTLQTTFLKLSSISTNSVTISSGLVSTSNGIVSTGVPTNSLSASILIQSNQIYARYNGLSSGGLLYSRGVTTVSKLSVGHYRFNYINTGTAFMIPTTQIFGIDALGYAARTLTITNSSCDVKILSGTNGTRDANITLLINY